MSVTLTVDDIKKLAKSQDEIEFILEVLKRAPGVSVVRDDDGEVSFKGIKLK